jgi:integrase
MPLNDLEVKRAKPKEKPYRISDGGNLYLWVTTSGGKLWRWAYLFQGKEKLMSFGKYPDVPLALARSRHADARRLLATGVDPMAMRKAEKEAGHSDARNSFASVSALWLEHWSHGKSPRHVGYVTRRIQGDILPKLGRRTMDQIEAPELVAMLRAIDERGAHDIAKRALETTSQIFRYGIAHGYAKRNPANDIRPGDVLKSTRRVNYSRIGEKELPEFLKRVEVYPGTHVTRIAIKLLALTFVRTSELIEAPWSEIDFKSARWDIPAERMKAHAPHIVPLASQTIELLQILKRLTGDNNGLLFPGNRKASQPMSNNTILKGIERMGYKGRMTGHGFRGLASTILHEQGYDHEHIELQLAHAPRNAVSAAYNHAIHLKARAQMMQAWADFLEKCGRSGS